jgi:hypothetical protein
MSGLAVMICLAASFMTGIWAVPPEIRISPDRPLNESTAPAWADIKKKGHAAIRTTINILRFKAIWDLLVF